MNFESYSRDKKLELAENFLMSRFQRNWETYGDSYARQRNNENAVALAGTMFSYAIAKVAMKRLTERAREESVALI